VGYLVAIAGSVREFVPDTFQFAFAQGDTVYYKRYANGLQRCATFINSFSLLKYYFAAVHE
jgi:hypothetical protein